MREAFLFFDVGGTLLHIRPSLGAAFAATCGDLGIGVSLAGAESAVARATSLAGPGPSPIDLAENRHWWFSFYEDFLDALGMERHLGVLAPELWKRHRAGDWLAPAPDAIPTLEALALAGHSMGVISNWDDTLPAILGRLGLLRFFSVVVASGEVGVAKPDPRIFELAVSMAGVRPADSFHVGDDAHTDVGGALGAGLRPVFIGARGSVPDSTPVIAALADLPGILGPARPR